MRMNPPTLPDTYIYDPDAYRKVSDSKPQMYVSAPIFGQSEAERADRFERGRVIAEHAGFTAVLPPELKPEDHEDECPPGRRTEGSDHAEACWFKADLKALLVCDAILLMDGWVSSWGCKLELQIAGVCGIDAYVPVLDRFDSRLVLL